MLCADCLPELMQMLTAQLTGESFQHTFCWRTTVLPGSWLCTLVWASFDSVAASGEHCHTWYCSLRGGEDTITYGSPESLQDTSGHVQHSDMITSIISLPAKGHMKERYVTTSKDGTFRFWQAKVSTSHQPAADSAALQHIGHTFNELAHSIITVFSCQECHTCRESSQCSLNTYA